MSTTQALTLAGDAGFSHEQISIIKSQVTPDGTTDAELALFLQYCQRTGLDPFARQIYLSERRSQDRNGNWITTRKPETTIDGFRLLAERSGQYAGQLGPFWCGEDGQWVDVWTARDYPIAARIGVLRHDFKEPLWAVALYDEYVQTKKDGTANSMWKKMPANQLAKCAESLALRRAFPRELSGLYTKEELPSEQHDAKEAQREYLADKGLEPYSAKEAALARQKPVPATIREFANIDPEPPSPENSMGLVPNEQPSARTIEMRHAAQVAETAEVLRDTAKPAKAKRGGVTFDVLGHFKEIKGLLREATGDDTAYYAILRANGFAKSNEITDNDKAREIYRALGLAHKRTMEEKKLRTEMELAKSQYGEGAVLTLLWEHSCNSIEDTLALAAEPLEALRKAIKALGRTA